MRRKPDSITAVYGDPVSIPGTAQDSPMVGYSSGEAAGPGPVGTVTPAGVTEETTGLALALYLQWSFEEQQETQEWEKKRDRKRHDSSGDEPYDDVSPFHVDRSLWKRPKSRLGRNGVPKLRQEVRSRASALRWRP